MTDAQKKRITELRSQGNGYKKIAQLTGISVDTVKSFCRRNSIPTATAAEGQSPDNSCTCLSCGKPIMQAAKQKPKKFCSDHCRNKWWNAHLDLVKRNANYDFTCQYCGKKFTAYGNKNRKYCCHACYIEDRFGGVQV